MNQSTQSLLDFSTQAEQTDCNAGFPSAQPSPAAAPQSPAGSVATQRSYVTRMTDDECIQHFQRARSIYNNLRSNNQRLLAETEELRAQCDSYSRQVETERSASAALSRWGENITRDYELLEAELRRARSYNAAVTRQYNDLKRKFDAEHGVNYRDFVQLDACVKQLSNERKQLLTENNLLNANNAVLNQLRQDWAAEKKTLTAEIAKRQAVIDKMQAEWTEEEKNEDDFYVTNNRYVRETHRAYLVTLAKMQKHIEYLSNRFEHDILIPDDDEETEDAETRSVATSSIDPVVSAAIDKAASQAVESGKSPRDDHLPHSPPTVTPVVLPPVAESSRPPAPKRQKITGVFGSGVTTEQLDWAPVRPQPRKVFPVLSQPEDIDTDSENGDTARSLLR